MRHLGVPEVLQCDNGREFKDALLAFLKKHNVKLINGRRRTPRTQGLVKQANAVVKIKFENGEQPTVPELGQRCINRDMRSNQHEFLPTGVTPSQLIFLCKPKIQNTRLASPTEEKSVLRQLSADDMDYECETIVTKKGKTTVLASHYLFEMALDLIPVEEGRKKKT